jgi:hypothetical protein
VSLFQPGEFWSHSGVKLPFKIECDQLTEQDLDLFATLIATRLHRGFSFRQVVGVPRAQPGGRDNGGVLAQYVKRHLRLVDSSAAPTLVVDDVLTTGTSMEAERTFQRMPCLGAVIWARGPCPEWVRPLFTLNEACW